MVSVYVKRKKLNDSLTWPNSETQRTSTNTFPMRQPDVFIHMRSPCY